MLNAQNFIAKLITVNPASIRFGLQTAWAKWSHESTENLTRCISLQWICLVLSNARRNRNGAASLFSRLIAICLLTQLASAADKQIYSLIAHSGNITIWVSFDEKLRPCYYGKSKTEESPSVLARDFATIGDRDFRVEVSPINIKVTSGDGPGAKLQLTRQASQIASSDLKTGVKSDSDGNWAASFVSDSIDHFPKSTQDFERLTLDQVKVIANKGIIR